MPRGGGSRRPRASRRRGGSRNHIGDEFLTFSLNLGSSQGLTFASLSTRPAKCAIRPIFMKLTATAAYSPGLANDALGGFQVPAAVDMQLKDPSNKVVAASRPVMLGTVPLSAWVRYPRSGDWFSPDTAPTTPLANFNAICLGTTATGGKAAYIRGIIHIRYAFSYEVLVATCPSYVHLTDEPPITGTWAEHVELVYPLRQLSLSDVRPTSVVTESCESVVIDLEFLE